MIAFFKRFRIPDRFVKVSLYERCACIVRLSVVPKTVCTSFKIRIRRLREDIGPMMSVSLAVDMTSAIELGGCIFNESESGLVPVDLCSCVFYEYVNGWT